MIAFLSAVPSKSDLLKGHSIENKAEVLAVIKDKDKFSIALETHRLWQKTIGAQGERLIAEGLDLRDVSLLPEDLSECALGSVDFSGMNLSGFDLYAAHLVNCNFQGADLSNANLLKATLDGSIFKDANLRGADLRRASLVDTDLRGVDLDEVIASSAT